VTVRATSKPKQEKTRRRHEHRRVASNAQTNEGRRTVEDTTLRWRKATRERGPACLWRVWYSHCGRYRVVRSLSSRLAGAPADRVYACVRVGDAWLTISRHRKESAARTACQQHARSSTNHGGT
jgi:hypothetical protein